MSGRNPPLNPVAFITDRLLRAGPKNWEELANEAKLQRAFFVNVPELFPIYSIANKIYLGARTSFLDESEGIFESELDFRRRISEAVRIGEAVKVFMDASNTYMRSTTFQPDAAQHQRAEALTHMTVDALRVFSENGVRQVPQPKTVMALSQEENGKSTDPVREEITKAVAFVSNALRS